MDLPAQATVPAAEERLEISYEYHASGEPPKLVVKAYRVINMENGIALATPKIEHLGTDAAMMLLGETVKNMGRDLANKAGLGGAAVVCRN